MKSFRLLQLPLVALQQIVVHLDFIKFATTSRRCKILVKILLPLKVHRLTITHLSYEHMVSIEFRPFMEYHRHFKTLDDQEKKDADEYNFYFKYYSPYIHTYNYENESDPSIDFVSDADKFVKFVREIFPIDDTEFDVNSDGFSDFHSFFMDQIVNRKSICTLFRYGGRNKTEALPILDEDVHFVLNNLPSDIGFCLYGEESEKFRYDKNLNFPEIYLSSPDWFTREHLFHSKFNHLTIWHKSILTLSDYNIFVKKWLNHEINPNFESLWIGHPRGYEEKWTENEAIMKDLLDGIETKPYDDSRNLEEYPSAPCLNRFGILLDVDRGDKIASFSISDDRLIFRVWNKGDHF